MNRFLVVSRAVGVVWLGIGMASGGSARAYAVDLADVIPAHIREAIDTEKRARAAASQTRGMPLGIFSLSVPGLGTESAVDYRSMEPKTVDLRWRDTAIKSQFPARKCRGFPKRVGTCAAFGLVAAMENALGGFTELSERHLWSQMCVPSSEAAIEALSNGSGVVEEAVWPESWTHPVGEPARAPQYGLQQVQLLQDRVPAMIEAMDRGKPLYLAINTPQDMWEKRYQIRASSPATGGGHAVAVVGYQIDPAAESGVFLILKNSWGRTMEFSGYQVLDTGYCEKPGNYCAVWSIENVGRVQQ